MCRGSCDRLIRLLTRLKTNQQRRLARYRLWELIEPLLSPTSVTGPGQRPRVDNLAALEDLVRPAYRLPLTQPSVPVGFQNVARAADQR
jgi:hypothetical protein